MAVSLSAFENSSLAREPISRLSLECILHVILAAEATFAVQKRLAWASQELCSFRHRMCPGATIHLNRYMAKTSDTGKLRFVGSSRQKFVGHYARYHSIMARTDAPDMQIRETVSVNLQPGPNQLFKRCIARHIDKHATCRAYQTPRPIGDDASSDNAHHGVHPNPAELTARKQADNRKHRYCGIGKNVDIGHANLDHGGGHGRDPHPRDHGHREVAMRSIC